MRVELHTTPAVFTELAAEWDALMPASNSLNFFMRPDWQRTWWKYLQRGDLLVLIIRQDTGALQGIAPLFCEVDAQGRRTIGVVGCVDVTDYVDLIYAPGYERQTLEAVWGFLCSADAPAWDTIQICTLPQDSLTLTLLPQIVGRGGSCEVAVEDVCPVLDLPDNYEAYLSALDKKQRHELRRKRRRAEAYPVSWYAVGPEHNLAEEIKEFLKLMAASTPEKASFLQMPGHREFFEEIGTTLFDQGMLDLTFLTVEGQRAAAVWSFAYGDRMMLYNSGLDPSAFPVLSPGIVLLTFNIERAIRRGFKKYDFLQGDEEYKFRMGAQRTTVHRLTIHR